MKSRKHLFIQLGSYNLAELAEHLEQLHQAGGPLIDLIVTQTGDYGGHLYTAALDILDPYLPWGPKRLAANVFFGTNVQYAPGSEPYGRDMLTADFRWTQLLIQRRLLTALNARYPDRNWHFYIEHEAVLERIVTDSALSRAYEAFLIQSIRDFRGQFRPFGAVAWSPAFWNTNVPQGAKTHLEALFNAIKTWTGDPGLDWILLQDMTGRAWGDTVKPAHVKAWMDALGNSFRSKQVNVEQFRTVGTGLVPKDPAVVAQTEQAYRNLGLQIGAAWEMRWYMRQQAAVETGWDTLAKVGKGASWPRLAARNTWQWHRDKVSKWLRTGAHTGAYSRRAALAEHVGREIRRLTGLEVQGIRYMRPYTTNPSTGRAVNSDHLTAGAIDIMIRTDVERRWLPQLYKLLDELQRRHVVRYRINLGQNAAHWDHIHVSFQIGATL
jgi:hypothetical protein